MSLIKMAKKDNYPSESSQKTHFNSISVLGVFIA